MLLMSWGGQFEKLERSNFLLLQAQKNFVILFRKGKILLKFADWTEDILQEQIEKMLEKQCIFYRIFFLNNLPQSLLFKMTWGNWQKNKEIQYLFYRILPKNLKLYRDISTLTKKSKRKPTIFKEMKYWIAWKQSKAYLKHWAL